jgi:hypothetical protein
MLRRKHHSPAPHLVNDRAWSSRSNVHARDVGKDIVRHTPLPAETGPVWAPDQLSIWPVEGGRYGIDAIYHGASGEQRADHQLMRLRKTGLDASVRLGALHGGATLRLGPLAHDAAWLALQAFLGRPLTLEG